MSKNGKKLYYREYSRNGASGKQKTRWVPTDYFFDDETKRVVYGAEDDKNITCSSVGCELARVGGCDRTFCVKLLPPRRKIIANAIKILMDNKKYNFGYEEIFEIFPDVTEGFIMAVLDEGA